MSKSDESLLGSLASVIPGYGSYRDLETRREDDRQMREFLVRRLRDCKASLDKTAKAAADQGDLVLPSTVAALRDRVDLAERRLAAAVEGYAGWFSSRQVDRELLDKVVKLDENLVSLVDQMDSLAQQLSQADATHETQLKEATDLLHARLDRREETLRAGS